MNYGELNHRRAIKHKFHPFKIERFKGDSFGRLQWVAGAYLKFALQDLELGLNDAHYQRGV